METPTFQAPCQQWSMVREPKISVINTVGAAVWEKGFQLIEIMVVVIVGILAAFAIPNFLDTGRRRCRPKRVRTWREFLWPKCLFSLNGKSSATSPISASPWLDPETNRYTYRTGLASWQGLAERRQSVCGCH